MLNPHSDRVDYGHMLRAPAGFSLSYALATSFTLELDTLICLPLALCFDNTLEGELAGEKLALLEAIGQLNGRLKVFFQQGNIKIPLQFNRLFTLLEPCLAPVVPESAFASFHPKAWLLRFLGPGNEVAYRLIVLSRNLSFDRSWDLAVTLEGRVGSQVLAESDGLRELLAALKPGARDFARAFACFEKELPRVSWRKPLGFQSLKTLAGGPQSVPLELGGETSQVLVMSPFLDPKALDWIGKRGEKHWLLSRAEELDRIGAQALAQWRCFALSDRVVSGEDELDGARAQNLHAKLVAVQNGATTHWHVGSANATRAALGDGNVRPRNTEFMVRLTGRGEEVCIDRLLRELVGAEEKPPGIFVPHEFSEQAETEELLSDTERRKLEHALIKAPWKMTATLSGDGTYQCEVRCETVLPIPPACAVEVGQLASDAFVAFSPVMAWSGLALTQISAFLPIRVRADGAERPVIQLMLKAALAMPGGDGRVQKIMHELIDTPEKFLAYVRLLLLPDPEKAEWFDVDVGRGQGPGEESLNRLFDGPVFESLLRSAARQPEQIKRIDALLESLQAAKAPVPEDFARLWAHFRIYAQGKRR